MKTNKQLTQADVNRIEKIAAVEFNYTGEDYNYAGDTQYIGQDGEFDFGGKVRTFAGEHLTGETYGFAIKNNHTSDVAIALCPAYFDTKARMLAHGITVDGIFADGTITTISSNTVVGTAINGTKSIYSFLEFIKRNPTRIASFSLTSTLEEQFDKMITYQNVSPFRQLGEKTIPLTEFLDTAQLNVKKIEANLLAHGYDLEFNDQNVIILTVAAGADLRFNFRIGAVNNQAGKLNKRATQAHKNLKRTAASRI